MATILNPITKIYLEKALKLAEQRKGFCSPNPAVGAIVVKNEKIIGQGCHWKAGAPHAEVMALAGLTPEQTRGADIYVTLEPCVHHGKTPPCTDLLIKHQLSAVYYGFKDPNPVVKGKGEETLKAAGVKCKYISMPEMVSFYQSYDWWWKYKRPWVTAKIALSLDGKIAGPQGIPVQLTSDAMNRYTHDCRKRADAILTTATTIIKDDPRLNARIEGQTYPKKIYVLDRNLTLQNTAQVFDTAEKVCLLHSSVIHQDKLKEVKRQNVQYVALPEKNGKLLLSAALDVIGAEGVHDIWIEAGGTCFQSFLSERLVNRALVYIAPKVLGEHAWPAFSGDQNIFAELTQVKWHTIGRDALCEMLR